MKFFSLFLLFLQTSFACEIFLKGKIIITSNHPQSNQAPFLHQNCDEKSLNIFTGMLSDFSGDIETSRLESLLEGELQTKVKIKSDSPTISFIQVPQLIKQQFKLPENSYLDTSLQNAAPIMEIGKNAFLKLVCTQCNFDRLENIILLIDDAGNTNTQKFDIEVRIKQMVEAYELSSNLNAFAENLTPQIFKRTLVESNALNKPFTDMKNIQFYRTNKFLKKGHVLSQHDVVPLTLVKAGNKTEIIFTSDSMSVKTFGIARQHGGMNDLVEVYNQNNNRKYIGKVIENNKVEVKL